MIENVLLKFLATSILVVGNSLGQDCHHEYWNWPRYICANVTLEPGKPIYMPDHTPYLYFKEGGALETIPAGMFVNLKELVLLSMPDQGIQVIEPDAFMDLANLKELNLVDNELTSITKGMFHGCSNLETLDLARNNIETIDPESFSDLTYLTSLYLSDNNIKYLPNGLFSSLNLLTRLDLDLNKFETLTPNMFNGLTNLYEINLQSNLIRYIEEDAFKGLDSLTKMSIYNNSIGYVGTSNFAENVQNLELVEIHSIYFECNRFYELVGEIRKFNISIVDPVPYRCIETDSVQEIGN